MQATVSVRRKFLIASALVLSVGLLPLTVRAESAKPKIGFIGAGRMGSGLAKLWAAAGYQVMLSARDLDSVKQLAAQIGPNASAGTPAQAAAWADVVVVTVPYSALPSIGKEYAPELKGKIVLDTCNPSPQRDGPMTNEAIDKGTGVMDPIYLPGTRLVRAFNTVNYALLASPIPAGGERHGVPLAADDKKALKVAVQLVRDAGFEPVIVGKLSTAKSFDMGHGIHGTMTASEVRTALGIK
jgi:8-hydroxy-5-deazaflavin:NADPH oxidoreductase